MGQATLVRRVPEPVVAGEPVTDQDPVPVETDHPLERVRTPTGVDHVAGRPLADPGVQPRRLASDAPTGLVHGEAVRVADLGADLLVGGGQAVRRARDDLGGGSARQLDAEEGVEQVGDLAVGEAGFFVQGDDRGLGVGADLAAGRAEGVGGLEGVPAPEAATAAVAAADVDVELPDDGLAGDVGLELGGDFGLDDGAAAAGAGVGEWGLEDLVDAVGGGRRSVAVGAVGLAGLSSGSLGVGLGWSLAERCGLAFGGASGCVEFGAEAFDLGAQRVVEPPEFIDGAEEFVVGRQGLAHVTQDRRGLTVRPEGTLNKYSPTWACS